MFTAAERITIDGRLAAFEGETMSDEEAEKRGITAFLAEAEKKPKRKRTAKKKTVEHEQAEETEETEEIEETEAVEP